VIELLLRLLRLGEAPTLGVVRNILLLHVQVKDNLGHFVELGPRPF
jgi:hypothetical protein